MDQETAALLLTAFIVGNTIFQLPIGWLADHYPKQQVMAGCAIVTAIASALIPISFGTFLLWPVLLVCGAASAGIYTVALSELGERFSGNELVAGTASFATVWGLGAIFGALLGGLLHQHFADPVQRGGAGISSVSSQELKPVGCHAAGFPGGGKESHSSRGVRVVRIACQQGELAG
jgi:MFS family permease